MLGTNGGGFFNVNASHPSENATALINLVQIYAILVIPAALFNMLLGEVIFGGVGPGFYGMVLYVVLTVFLAGLLVGRTPKWLGKKIEAREVKLAAVTALIMPIGVLVLAAASILTGNAQSAVQDAGPHGLTELIYAYSSGTANNGRPLRGSVPTRCRTTP